MLVQCELMPFRMMVGICEPLRCVPRRPVQKEKNGAKCSRNPKQLLRKGVKSGELQLHRTAERRRRPRTHQIAHTSRCRLRKVVAMMPGTTTRNANRPPTARVLQRALSAQTASTASFFFQHLFGAQNARRNRLDSHVSNTSLD